MHREEVESGERFEFGKNWQRFLSHIDEETMVQAENSLKKMLDLPNLEDKTFLDIGSGSGLFSLAARRLGAKVSSLDYDPQSVACTEELKKRYFNEEENWTVSQGSVLDKNFIEKLGSFDVVYSWGVLHHTGDMKQAFENALTRVAPKGHLFISIYNDQGSLSSMWKKIKVLWNRSPRFFRFLIFCGVAIPYQLAASVSYIIRFKNPLKLWFGKRERGMNVWTDWIDWLGGYPFEVAKPEQVLKVFREHGFELLKMKTCGGKMGCNEFLFLKQNKG